MASKPDSRPVVGVDLGGTHMQFGVVDRNHAIIGRARAKTDSAEGSEAVIARLVAGVHEACRDASLAITDIAAVGVASAGAIDTPRGLIVESPNLRWYDLPLRDILADKLNTPVALTNDVNGAVWGEYHLGAGKPPPGSKSAGDVFGLWIGTGVGGGLVIHGRIYDGDRYTAGEIGHTIMEPDAPRGRRTVEDLCSRSGMSRTIREALPRYPDSMLAELIDAETGIVSSRALAQAAAAGDELAILVANRSAHLVGITLANVVTLLAMDCVIVGGGITEAMGEPFLQRIRASFDEHVFPARNKACRIVPTQLADNAGLLGAALLAQEF